MEGPGFHRRGGGTPTREFGAKTLLGEIFVEDCMKMMKKIGPGWGFVRR